MNILALLAGLFSGILGSMGLGGGAVLIIYLSVFKNVGQLKSQGTNLIFFIPIALFSVVYYTYKKQIKWKTVLPIITGGIIGGFGGVLLTTLISEKLLSKAFGVFLILLGIKEIANLIKQLLKKKKNNDIM